MREKIRNIKGIVIRTRAFMENDMCVNVLTETGEKLDLIVKGARNGKSKRKPHLELMNLVSGTVYESKNHSYLQSVICEKSFHRLKNSCQSVFSCYELLDLVNHSVLPDDPQPEIYEILKNTFDFLDSDKPHFFAVDFALIKLADRLGFLPSFKNCGLCHRIMNEEIFLNWDNCAVHCVNCKSELESSLEMKYRKAIEFFRVASHEILHKISLSEVECETLRSIIETALLKSLPNRRYKPVTLQSF